MNLIQRPRRLRISSGMRDLVRETELSPRDFVYPIFVVPGEHVKEEIPSMPGCYHYSVDQVADLAREIAARGIPAVEVFGLPAYKDEIGSSAWDMTSPVQRAIAAIKEAVPQLLVVGDVCLCQYTSHGHCGELHDHYVDNDATLPHLVQTAVSQARAGADIVAPSDMMDGRIAAMRQALDEAGYEQLPIMSYAAKFSSAFYGPFRDAADSAPSFGDRRSYQMDPANIREAMREIEGDIAEGADIIMVKPALPYLDVIRWARDRYDLPLAAYQVSGEYAMIQAAGLNGWIDRERIMMESLLSIKRAGADLILTYFAREAAELLRR